MADALNCPPVTLDRKRRRATGPACKTIFPVRSKTTGKE